MSHVENFAMSNSYNDLSKQQEAAIKKSFALIDEFLPKSHLYTKKSVTLADYGCSEGKNSMEIMEFVIQLLRKKNPKVSISIYFEDLESNSWSTIFKIANQVLSKYDNVFFAAIGKTFYDRNLPENFVDFAFSGNSFHWASKVLPVSDHFFPSVSKNISDRKAWRDLSLSDWETIVSHRSAELQPNGLFFANFVGSDGHVRRLAWISDFYQILFSAVKSGLITEEERSSLVVPVHMRIMDDVVNPKLLEKYGLTCLFSKVDHIKNPYLEGYFENKKNGMVEKEAAMIFAKQNVGSKRAYGEYFYRSMLKRPEQEKDAVLDQLFQPLVDNMAKNPEVYNDDLFQIFVVFQKKNSQSRL
jgi:gibberellin A4 carboxyl methyltransferase